MEITLPADSDDTESDDSTVNNEDIRKFLNYREENVDTTVLGRAINSTRFVPDE